MVFASSSLTFRRSHGHRAFQGWNNFIKHILHIGTQYGQLREPLHWQQLFRKPVSVNFYAILYKEEQFPKTFGRGENLICWTSSAVVGIDTFYPKWGATINKGLGSPSGITYQVQQHLPSSTCTSWSPTPLTTSSSLQIFRLWGNSDCEQLMLCLSNETLENPIYFCRKKKCHIQFTCSAKTSPWGSNWRSPDINIEYCWVDSWENLRLCCFVPTVSQNFRERNDMSYWGFIQTNVNQIYALVFSPHLVKWTSIKFYCQTEWAAQNFSHNSQ